MAQEAALPAIGDEAPPRSAPGPWGMAMRALLRRKLAVASLLYISIFYLTALFAPLVAPHSYRAQDLDNALQSPSLEHPFGTDRLGRDMFSRVVYATRTTAVITLIVSVSGGLVLGPLLGLVAGYRRGWVDALINRVGEVVSSLPDLMIMITLAATVGPRLNDWIANYYDAPLIGEQLKAGFGNLLVLSLVLTWLGWVGPMRFNRAQTLQLRESDYVLAARALGAGTWRVITRHILPNLMHFMVLATASTFGAIALAEISLSFLGLGVRPPTPSFGEMILSGAGVRTLERHPHLLLFPGGVAVLLMISFNLLADALNDVLNPRTRSL